MKTNTVHLYVGRKFSTLEFEEQADVRRLMRLGLARLDGDHHVVAL